MYILKSHGDPCNLIGSQLCDLFTSHAIFCSKSHVLNRVIRVLICINYVLNRAIFALYRIISVWNTK